MASTHTKKKRARRHNAAPRRHRRPMTARHHRRRNPGQVGSLVKSSVSVIGGAVGSKIIPQMVLGSKNTGIFGYLANAVSGGLLAWGARAFLKDQGVSNGIMVGTAVQIILRIIGDNTTFGSYLSLSGLGDYMAWNGAAPQTLADGLNSPLVRMPSGWGAALMPAPAVAANGMGSYSMYNRGRRSLY